MPSIFFLFDLRDETGNDVIDFNQLKDDPLYDRNFSLDPSFTQLLGYFIINGRFCILNRIFNNLMDNDLWDVQVKDKGGLLLNTVRLSI